MRVPTTPFLYSEGVRTQAPLSIASFSIRSICCRFLSSALLRSVTVVPAALDWLAAFRVAVAVCLAAPIGITFGFDQLAAAIRFAIAGRCGLPLDQLGPSRTRSSTLRTC